MYLSDYFQKQTDASVAIFYTSQGIPGVSTILGVIPVVVFCRTDTSSCTETEVGTRTCPLPLSAAATKNLCWDTQYDPILSWPGVQRSSVNVFYYLGNQFQKQYNEIDETMNKNDNILNKFKFQQCYDFNYASQTRSKSGNRYCQYSGNLANKLLNYNSVTATTIGVPTDGSAPVIIASIQAKICTKITKNVFADTYGSCNVNSPSPHDLDANMISDIVWRDTSGDVVIWLMDGAAVASSAGLGNLPTTWSIVGQRDFDGNGTADLLWRDTSGNTAIWFMNGAAVASTAGVGSIPTSFTVVATGDFNGDGLGDILWQDASGNLAVWMMNGATVSTSASIGNVPTNWSLAGTGDFDGDGKADLLWRDNLGNNAIWLMNGATIASTGGLGNVPTTWTVAGIGDFDGDGKSDIVWRDGSGNTAFWLMNGAAVASAAAIGSVPSMWSLALTGDYNGDGKSDLLWRDTSGDTAVWFMNGTAVASTASLGNVPTNWTVQSVNAE
jgi:VCBS repeat protein